jgi:hypothetical protein
LTKAACSGCTLTVMNGWGQVVDGQ